MFFSTAAAFVIINSAVFGIPLGASLTIVCGMLIVDMGWQYYKTANDSIKMNEIKDIMERVEKLQNAVVEREKETNTQEK